jgi:nucleoside-diphosphate-sugar epimerase
MTRVLVTGASGFVGRRAVSRLVERGFEVHAVTRREPTSFAWSCKWHVSNLLDQGEIGALLQRVRPTHLLHLAWHTVPVEYWNARDNFAWVQASLELMRWFHDVGGSRLVMAGTCAEYDWRYGWCSEGTTPTVPRTTYGVCKNALSSLVAAFADSTGISAAWGRIFFLYGPYEHPTRFVSSVVRSLLRGEVARCSAGMQMRDFLHVHDAADALVALLESRVDGAVNIGSGHAECLSDVAGRIADIVGRGDLLQLGALPGSPDDPPFLCADVRRLCGEVRWSPFYDLETGLNHTIQWWTTCQRRGLVI